MAAEKRKGSKSINDIPKDILNQLNKGEIETTNLVEWLAVDQRILLENLLKQYNRIKYLKPILKSIEQIKKQSVNTINEAIGTGLLTQALAYKDTALFLKIYNHTSDIVRCWLAYTIGKNQKLNVKQMLQQIQLFAADKHFGVREVAWLAVRQAIAENLNESLIILSKWTLNKDQSIRRFASEATRPRGVWCRHIETLKQKPELGLCILEPLKSDESKYVQDSVGNWLNDASKTQPNFVLELCNKWNKESKTKETSYIIKKALRTIKK